MGNATGARPAIATKRPRAARRARSAAARPARRAGPPHRRWVPSGPGPSRLDGRQVLVRRLEHERGRVDEQRHLAARDPLQQAATGVGIGRRTVPSRTSTPNGCEGMQRGTLAPLRGAEVAQVLAGQRGHHDAADAHRPGAGERLRVDPRADDEDAPRPADVDAPGPQVAERVGRELERARGRRARRERPAERPARRPEPDLASGPHRDHVAADRGLDRRRAGRRSTIRHRSRCPGTSDSSSPSSVAPRLGRPFAARGAHRPPAAGSACASIPGPTGIDDLVDPPVARGARGADRPP